MPGFHQAGEHSHADEIAPEGGNSDAELMAQVRAGRIGAFGRLYQRHVAAAYRMARGWTTSKTEDDELVADAFANMLEALRRGRGPEEAFRPYLYAVLRNLVHKGSRMDRAIELDAAALAAPFADPVVAGFEMNAVARAFLRLPERWRTVLWHTEVEGETPAEIAPLFGLTPNGVSALAYRAREGLRQAYLQAHIVNTIGEGEACRATISVLGAWNRGGLSKRWRREVDRHLSACERCRAVAEELAEINSGLRALLVPAVLREITADWFSEDPGMR